MLLVVLRRALWTAPVLLVCVGPLRHGPPLGLSNEAWVKYSDTKPEAITRNMQRRLGIDVPWYEQYVRYLGNLARLDFGPTTTFPGRSVNSILKERGPVTLELAGLALVWVAVLGIGLGVAAAVWRGSAFDRAITASTALLTAIPSFCSRRSRSGVLSVKLGLLPTSGYRGRRAGLRHRGAREGPWLLAPGAKRR